MKVKESEVAQSCPTLCDAVDCSPLGSSVHGILQARILEWGAILTWEGHKTQAQPSLHLWGLPECLNLSGLDLGGACSSGPALDGSWKSNLEHEQCGQGGHRRQELGQTQCSWDTESTCQCYLFAASLLPHSVTEQVSQKKCPPALCQGRSQTLKRPANRRS